MRKNSGIFFNHTLLSAWALVLLSCCAQVRPTSDQDARLEIPPAQDRRYSDASQSRYHPVVNHAGMIASDDRIASEWGAEILRQGGNAMDAAIATEFMLSVTRPHWAALGGGGFVIYCPKPENKTKQPCAALDFREKAPKASTRDMYVVDSKPRSDLSQTHPLSIGVPGVVAGMALAHEKWGKLPFAKLLSRPIEVAQKGARITGYMEYLLNERWATFNEDSRKIFSCGRRTSDSEAKPAPCLAGDTFKQPELAQTLSEISKKGKDGFYTGAVAMKLSHEVRLAGGILTEEDLKTYEPKLREPLRGEYRGMEIVTMGPPSAGGAGVISLLKYAALADKAGEFAEGYGSARAIQAIATGMKLTFADRAEYFGDPDFVDVPLTNLLSDSYIDERWGSAFQRPMKSIDRPEFQRDMRDNNHETTHFSVVDKEGNAVSTTITVNYAFGSGFMPKGTGVIMNDQMDDFSLQPGVPNQYGLVGAEANAIAPGKRPLSSMSPTIVRDQNGEARIVIGAQGGPKITTAVFQSLLNRLRFGLSLMDAMYVPRFHHQWKPNVLMLERNGFAPEVVKKLEAQGNEIRWVITNGKMHAIERSPEGNVMGIADLRDEGTAVGE